MSSQSNSRTESPKPKSVKSHVKRFFRKMNCSCSNSCKSCPVCNFVKEHKKQFGIGLAAFILYLAIAMTIDYKSTKNATKVETPDVPQQEERAEPAEEEAPQDDTQENAETEQVTDPPANDPPVTEETKEPENPNPTN